MKVIVDLLIVSEIPELYEKSVYFIKAIPNCNIEYLHKGEYKKHSDGRVSRLPMKNSSLHISSDASDYNNTLIQMFSVYEDLLGFLNKIEHYISIDISFFSNDMISLEFSVEVLGLLKKHNFSLPITCYLEKQECFDSTGTTNTNFKEMR